MNGGRGLVLTESKLAEHSFYSCSARASSGSDRRPANPDPSRCENALAVLDNPALHCQQAAWGRKYWDRLRAAINREAWAALPYCAAAHTGYQLFRQQALAEGLAAGAKYDFVISCVAFDERNKVLAQTLQPLGLAAIADWSRLFRGRARFKVFTHQKWVAWVRTHHGGDWSDWLSWIGTRYGYS